MALKSLLVLLPLQSLLLFAPAGQAQPTGTTRFLPEGYRGVTCRALKPGCMTKSQWAKHCRSRFLFRRPDPSTMSQSCRDALDLHPTGVRVLGPAAVPPGLKPPVGTYDQTLYLPSTPEPSTRFLPEFHTGPTCTAFMPRCMTRAQWAKYCVARRNADPNFVFPKSCRDALGVVPHRYGSSTKKQILPMDALLGHTLKHQR